MKLVLNSSKKITSLHPHSECKYRHCPWCAEETLWLMLLFWCSYGWNMENAVCDSERLCSCFLGVSPLKRSDDSPRRAWEREGKGGVYCDPQFSRGRGKKLQKKLHSVIATKFHPLQYECIDYCHCCNCILEQCFSTGESRPKSGSGFWLGWTFMDVFF